MLQPAVLRGGGALRQAQDRQAQDWQAQDRQAQDWQAQDWQAQDWQAQDRQAQGDWERGPFILSLPKGPILSLSKGADRLPIIDYRLLIFDLSRPQIAVVVARQGRPLHYHRIHFSELA